MKNFETNTGDKNMLVISPSNPKHDLSVKHFMDILRTIPKLGDYDFGDGVKVFRGYEDYILEYKKQCVDMGRLNYIAHTLRLAFYFIYNYLEDKTK